MFKKIMLAVLSFNLLFISTVAAERNTTISIEMGKDEQGNTNSMISADMRLSPSNQLFFGVGKSDIPSATTTIQNNQAFVGFSQKFNDKWKLTGMLDYSGLKDAFTMLSASAGMRLSLPVIFVELVPVYRRINLTTINDRDVIVNSGGLGFKTGFYLGEHFRLSGSVYKYDYSRDVSKLASFASLRFFSRNTLMLSSSLLEKSYTTETGLDFDSFSISAGINKTVSAIDFSESKYGYLVFDYYFSEAWSISLLGGKYDNTPENQDNFSSLTVNYSF